MAGSILAAPCALAGLAPVPTARDTSAWSPTATFGWAGPSAALFLLFPPRSRLGLFLFLKCLWPKSLLTSLAGRVPVPSTAAPRPARPAPLRFGAVGWESGMCTPRHCPGCSSLASVGLFWELRGGTVTPGQVMLLPVPPPCPMSCSCGADSSPSSSAPTPNPWGRFPRAAAGGVWITGTPVVTILGVLD